MDEKKLKVSFAPGAFDNFDGTQEELDELIAEITEYFSTHTKEEIMAEAVPLDETDLTEDEKDLIVDQLIEQQKGKAPRFH